MTGLNLAEYPNNDLYPTDFNGIELCLLLPRGMTIETATALPAESFHELKVMQKLRDKWRQVWPKASSKAPVAQPAERAVDTSL